jgi:alkylhydroperoxidase family enzyme
MEGSDRVTAGPAKLFVAERKASARLDPTVNNAPSTALRPSLTSAIYQCELEDRIREIAICRQARSARAPYELHQHRQVARNNGVSEGELAAVLSDPVVGSLDEHANLVCQAADELEATATLRMARRTRCIRRWDFMKRRS